MVLYPKDIFEKLEFNKILKILKDEGLGSPSRKYFDEDIVTDNLSVIKLRLTQTKEWLTGIAAGDSFGLSRYEDIDGDIPLLKKEGYVLDVESIQRIQNIVVIGNKLKLYFTNIEKQGLYPQLAKIAIEISIEDRLSKEIDRIFDEEGEVRPNASEALLKISKSIHNREREMAKMFRQEVVAYRERGYLVENLESVKNGRMVLVVGAEHKRKVPGIIHDESSTGKTVFIEPENIIAISNDIHSLYSERRSEIYKIIRALCDFLRPYADDILHTFQTLIYFDTIRSKAVFAKRIGARIPKLVEKPTFSIKGGYNPILILKSESNEMNVVPFDLELFGENRILILSGPNAGGKSVTLKSVGLLQLMIQAGIPVPVEENSTFGVFKSFFADIGDQQSMEDDLSTYSSHLTNMKKTVELSNAKSLVLIDEFGAGTDPKIGGAIAESILKQLHKQACFGVITTHYSNLKYFAYKTKGLVNASMEFNKQALIPTYRLVVGRPGSSFAFEIAQKIGLPEEVIDYARHKTGQNEKAIEELLVDLQSERKELEDKMTSILGKQDRLDTLVKNYEALLLDLEYKKKKFKLEQKEAARYSLDSVNREVQKVIKELKSKTNVEKLEAIVAENKVKHQLVETDIVQLKEEVFETISKNKVEFRVGSRVKMRNSETIGEIRSIDRGVAEIQLGFMVVKTNLNELLPALDPPKKKKEYGTRNNINIVGMGEPFETKLDIRGYRPDEALSFLQEFFELGIINNAFELKVIHGVGNGTLRKTVHKKIKEYKDIKEYFHPEPDQGGEGVTICKL